MKRVYRIILSTSALASALAVAPVWAQSAPTDTAGAISNMKDQATDSAVTSKVTAALNEGKTLPPWQVRSTSIRWVEW
jgi:hypothetical protein